MDESSNPVWERFRPDRVIGSHTLVFAEVDSTMDVAWQLEAGGAPHGTCVRAATQRMGRGRFSRRWVSDPGDSLLMSVLLRHPPIAPGAPTAIAATLAIADAVTEACGCDCGLKWPNDVQVDGKKIAGVLVEARTSGPDDFAAVLGIGLNVNLVTSAHPELAEIATSIQDVTGAAASIDEVEEVLLHSLDGWFAELDHPDRVVRRWKERLTTLGQEVTVHRREGAITGVAVDVDHNGHLLLRTPDRMVHRLSEGDVTLRA